MKDVLKKRADSFQFFFFEGAPAMLRRRAALADDVLAFGKKTEGSHCEFRRAYGDDARIGKRGQLTAHNRGAAAGDPGNKDRLIGLHGCAGDFRERRIERRNRTRADHYGGAVDPGVVEHHAERFGKTFSRRACAKNDRVDGNMFFRMRLVKRLNGSIGEPPDDDARGVGGIGGERGYAAVVGNDGGRAAGREVPEEKAAAAAQNSS